MQYADILQQRLHRQYLTHQPNNEVADIVSALVAVQAQEYAGAKWALGLRLPGSREADIEEAFNSGKILRTHVLRPTWHFVAPEDIRWLLQLTAPYIHALGDYYYRQAGLDKKIFAQCNRIIEEQLRDNNYRTRDELKLELEKAGIITDTLRLSFIMMHAELEQLVCSGPRKGKQFTYALMDERVPYTPTLTREEALALLTQRYFAHHGPATANDFAKWSGLRVTDAKEGIEMVKSALTVVKVEKNEFWFTPETAIENPGPGKVFLLPTYDEFLIGYKVNALFFDEGKANNSFVFDSTVLVDGIIKGNWQRTLTKNTADFTVKMFDKPTVSLKRKIESECQRYASFFGLKATVKYS